ncbi:MAG: ABC transporter permease [Myxococcales bacterium]|nr:ABC transporter permease [Myxococcales bacterium]
MTLIETILSVGFVAQALRVTVPYALAALGGTLAERAGVVSLALEGMLLFGAFTATLGSALGGPALGALCGIVGGLLVAAVYELIVVRWRADQVVCAIAINLLVLGLTRTLLVLVWGSASSSPRVPGLGSTGTWAFVAAAAVLALALSELVRRTPWGLRLRAAGERPDALASLGVDVERVRWGAVLASGALAGLGGAWLALDVGGFSDAMSSGRGYIALAAVVSGKWRPLGATAACLLFGVAGALELNLQAEATSLPRELVQMLPYVVTLIAVSSVARGARAPSALGQPLG